MTRSPSSSRILFVYGDLLAGEREHARLEGAEPLGAARTLPAYELALLGAAEGAKAAALVPGGRTAVVGELYRLSPAHFASLDVFRGVPLLFRRDAVRLEGGIEADAYLMEPEQVRGRRRLRSGDFRSLARPAGPEPGPRAAWARRRFDGS